MKLKQFVKFQKRQKKKQEKALIEKMFKRNLKAAKIAIEFMAEIGPHPIHRSINPMILAASNVYAELPPQKSSRGLEILIKCMRSSESE